MTDSQRVCMALDCTNPATLGQLLCTTHVPGGPVPAEDIGSTNIAFDAFAANPFAVPKEEADLPEAVELFWKMVRENYRGAVAAGFTEDQALGFARQLLVSMLTNVSEGDTDA